MNKKEHTLWQYLDRKMKGHWDVQRHEDKYSVGIADLSFAMGGRDGWIELKHLDKWPVNENAPVTISHFSAQQKNWLIKRGKNGDGRVFVLIKIEDIYLLFHYSTIRKLGEINKQDMLDLSLYDSTTINPVKLANILKY